jgi:hypothetical protein
MVNTKVLIAFRVGFDIKAYADSYMISIDLKFRAYFTKKIHI